MGKSNNPELRKLRKRRRKLKKTTRFLTIGLLFLDDDDGDTELIVSEAVQAAIEAAGDRLEDIEEDIDEIEDDG